MKRVLFLAMAAAGTLAWAVQPVAAQPALGQPQVSPWLQLRNGGGTLTTNYFNQVQPLTQYRAAINQVQQTGTATQEWTTGNTGELPATGHVSGFQTQMRYFGNLGGARTGGGGMANPLGNQAGQAGSAGANRGASTNVGAGTGR